MLILSRQPRQRIMIETSDGLIVVEFVEQIRSGKIRLGFEAPADVKIFREEVYGKPDPRTARCSCGTQLVGAFVALGECEGCAVGGQHGGHH